MKKITFMDVLTVLFMVGCIVVSAALLNESYVGDEEMPNALRVGMRIIGYVGCIWLPYVFGKAIVDNEPVEYCEEGK